ncbi:hypothetical protein BpHYR1_018241 [Brachionus plicatilis]|uniref:Uncharacterized protein n=1 Tax=Brachionus plicatilis TaxID=10195 RepID=A0A3M7QWP2_BRAPC|nr:hypothetical protein BpHYR1_018241 [Brachionus plicatilis]
MQCTSNTSQIIFNFLYWNVIIKFNADNSTKARILFVSSVVRCSMSAALLSYPHFSMLHFREVCITWIFLVKLYQLMHSFYHLHRTSANILLYNFRDTLNVLKCIIYQFVSRYNI